ncbi:MAG TPA: alpha/beta hydrolase [Microbacteriaceae bacterium]|nr:alpha/beta hydrolase [Microbacteriaceae bacterium]
MTPAEFTTTTHPDATLRYGVTDRQVADIFEPENPVDSLVLLLHGGMWRELDRMRTWAAGRAIAQAGHLVATIEYRVGTGRWAAALDDLATAIDQIQLSGREWTIHNEAPRTITLIGHSSGGQLALWAAGRHSLPTASRWHTTRNQVTGVVALAPAADLQTLHTAGFGEGAVADFLGGSPQEILDVYAQADPMELKPTIPVEILHGSADEVIPVIISEGYVQRHAGARVTLTVVDGVGHTEWGDPQSSAWPHLLAALTRVAS